MDRRPLTEDETRVNVVYDNTPNATLDFRSRCQAGPVITFEDEYAARIFANASGWNTVQVLGSNQGNQMEGSDGRFWRCAR